VLADACRTVGSPQIRNHATIGGNSRSLSAADAGGLSVLEAEVEVNRLGEISRVPLGESSQAVYTTLTVGTWYAIFVKKARRARDFVFTNWAQKSARHLAHDDRDVIKSG
jgi:CO/xanthine dehydrogenase FAD-binding subunit